jgi:hypothetical protein
MSADMKYNDSLFLSCVSCPLKLYHLSHNRSERKPYLPFKQRNKLQLRDAVALRYKERKFTSDSVPEAASETELWLQSEQAAICGAVVKAGRFFTRIPILLKAGDELTVIQIHGRLMKRSHSGVINPPVYSRSTAGYLLKAAYRMEVLKRAYPDYRLKVELFFPDKRYRSSLDRLLQQVANANLARPHADLCEEIEKLFTSIEATKAANAVNGELPENISHRASAGLSVSEVMNRIETIDWSKRNPFDVQIHRECKNCEFRQPGANNKSDCWSQFFSRNAKRFPDHHIFELIGHGNDEDIERGIYYQEDSLISEYSNSFERVKKLTRGPITIQQRRDLQILAANEKRVPEVWIKPDELRFEKLQFPLHFIDFEAATYALPMNRGSRPYNQIYFQFSCHTLYEDGTLRHSEWLDDDPKRGYPHIEFIEKFSAIESIFEGTLIQYSPFESQALHKLLAELQRNSMLYEEKILTMKKLLYREGGPGLLRIFDLSRAVRDGYYNQFMSAGIGLKHVMRSVMQLQCHRDELNTNELQVYDKKIGLTPDRMHEVNYNIYTLLQHPEYSVEDGAEAMDAYISLKSNLLSPRESEIIPTLLRRYCAMDSYALVLLYKHLRYLSEQNADKYRVIID